MENLEVAEGVDICCICDETAEYGTMTDVNEVDFELLCDKCKHKRCSNCRNIALKREGKICEVHNKLIEDISNKVCYSWESV